MPTNDKNQNQGNDRSRQGSNQMNQGSNQGSSQGSNQGSNQSTKQQASSTDRDTQSGLSGKSGSDDSMKKGSGSRSDSDR